MQKYGEGKKFHLREYPRSGWKAEDLEKEDVEKEDIEKEDVEKEDVEKKT